MVNLKNLLAASFLWSKFFMGDKVVVGRASVVVASVSKGNTH